MLAGIDPSSKRVAIVGSEPDGSNAWHEVVPLAARKADTYEPRYTAMAVAQVERIVRARQVDSVHVEVPLLGRGGVRTAVTLGFIAGAVQAGAVRAGADVHLVNVQTWKRTLGHGGASKHEVGTMLATLWPEMHAEVEHDQDLVDAAAICYHARVSTP